MISLRKLLLFEVFLYPALAMQSWICWYPSGSMCILTGWPCSRSLAVLPNDTMMHIFQYSNLKNFVNMIASGSVSEGYTNSGRKKKNLSGVDDRTGNEETLRKRQYHTVKKNTTLLDFTKVYDNYDPRFISDEILRRTTGRYHTYSGNAYYLPVLGTYQRCGSALVSMRIRIQHFLSMRIRIQIQGINTNWKKIYSYMRSLHPSKVNIWH